MSQYLAYKDNKIIAVAKTKEELENIPFIIFDEIIKTNENYVFVNNRYVLESKVKAEKAIAARLAEYPSLEDQLDMLYWDKVKGTNVWFNTINQIKKKYPKE